MGVVSLAIMDQTEKQIQAKTQEEVYAVIMTATDMAGEDGVNPGETVMLPLDQMFTPTMGYSITYGFEMEGMGVAEAAIMDGTNLEVTAMGEGQAKFTVTATATPAASGVEILPQTRANVAQVLFPIDVVLKVLSIDVTADPMMIDEGMTTMVMATANRNVTEDTMVALSIVGAVDMAPEAIMIEAGMDSGYVELTATADDDTENATVTVVAIHSAIEGGSKTIEITVNDTTDPPEPPTPTTYTLTAPESVMEGGEVEIDVKASQMVAEDTMIDLVLGAGSADADDYTVESLVIPAGSDTGGATLMATEDTLVEGDETLTLNGMMGNVVVGSVMLTITDNDMEDPPAPPTVTVKSQADVAAVFADATGANWMVGDDAMVDMSMLFDTESTSVVYSGMSSNEMAVTASSSGTMLTLMAIDAGDSTIMVTATDTVSSDSASASADVTVNLETLVVTVEPSANMVDEGGSVTITASTNRAVTAETMLAVTVTGDTAAVEADEMITIPMAGTSGTAMVMAVEDDDSADAMVSVVVTGAALGSPVTIDIAITDNDPTVSGKSQAEVTALFVTAVAMAGGADSWLPDGDAATVDMSELFSTNGSPTLEYMAMSSAEDMVMASASGSMLTLTPMETGSATITVTATDTSGDADDTASVSAMVTVGVLPLEIMVSPTTADLTEGETVDITATANKMVDANVEVMLIRDGASTAGDDDYSLMPVMITIMAGDVSGMATLTATDDDDVEGNESLRLTGTVGGMSAGMVMITIEDNDVETTYSLQASADMVEEGGAAVTITATANQMVRGNTEVMVMRDGSSQAGADDYSLEPALITIMDGAMSGTAMLTATDDYDVEGNESLTLNGMVGDMNAGSVMVTVVDNDVETTYTLSGPMDPNVAEGMSAELTVMASQMVRMDTTVMIMRDASSTGGDADFTAAAVTIMAGTDMGTTMVMAVEDNMMEDMEMLTLYGMVGDMRTNSVTLNLWDAAVPALPLIAQLLLAAFLAIGGYRRYLRR